MTFVRLALATATCATALLLSLSLLSSSFQISNEQERGLCDHVERDQTEHNVEHEFLVHEVVPEDRSIYGDQTRAYVPSQIIECRRVGLVAAAAAG